MSKKCIVCGKKLGLFERLLGSVCSIKCEDILNKSNNIEYPEEDYMDYPDITLDVPNIELYSIPVITRNSIKQAGYSVSTPISYSDSNKINDNFDDCFGDWFETGFSQEYFNNVLEFPSIGDDYNNSYDKGHPGYEDDWK